MALKADAQGFLAGDPIDIGTALGLWRNIGADVRAIRQSLLGNSGRPQVSASRGAGQQRYESARAPAARDSKGRFVSAQVVTPGRSSRTAVPGAAGRADKPMILAIPAPAIKPNGRAASRSLGVAEGPRDANGRFTGGGGAGSGDGGGDSSGGGIRGAMNRLSESIRGSAQGADGIDPAVAAFNEIAQPLARGWELLSGGDDDKKQTGLLRRIFGVLKGDQNEDSAFKKAVRRSLGVIEDGSKTGGKEAKGGIFGGLGGMAAGVLPLLKKIPLIGGLMAGAGALFDIFNSENDDTLSRREKDQRAGKAVGGAAGTVGGMMLGAKAGAALGALAGPVGAAIGGAIGGAAGFFFGDQAGQIIGESVGGWVNDLRAYDIPGKIVAAWDVATSAVKGLAETAMKKLEGAWGKAKELANNANNVVKEKTGIDVKENVKAGWDATKNAAKNAAGYVAENTSAGKGAAAIYNGAKNVVGKVIESGAGYNIVQRPDGSIEKQTGARNWRNNNPGNIEAGKFAEKHGAIGTDGRFAIFPSYEAGRNAKEKLIFDGSGGKQLSTKADYGSGLGYKDKLLTQAIAAYAPPEDKNNLPAYQKAVLDSVGGSNKRMGDYSPAERKQIMDAMERQEGFKPGRVTQVAQGASLEKAAQPPAQAVTTSVPVPSVPKVASAPPIGDAPPVVAPLNTPSANKQTTVVQPKDAGQDLSDRRIAHIVTGGLSNG